MSEEKIRLRRFLRCALECALAVCFVGSSVQAQTLKVILLGTGGPRPDMNQFGPSTLVEAGGRNFLFDCGRGATLHLSQLHISPAQIDGLFVTHLHSDHIVGISDLYLTGWVMGRKKPFQVWGPAGTQRMMEHLKEAYQFDIQIRQKIDLLSPEGVAIEAKDVSQGIVYEMGGVKVTAFLVHHGDVRPALGYRVDYAHHSVTISGDTGYSENLVRFAHGTDVLIINVVDPQALRKIPFLKPDQLKRIIPIHTTPEQAGQIFTRARVKLGVYTHFVPYPTPGLIAQTRKTYAGRLVVGKDLTEIDISDGIEIHEPRAVALSPQ
jgi:ribonuclease Z